MKHPKTKRSAPRILGVICIALILFFLCVQLYDYAEAQSINKTVLATLEAMGITDAQRSSELESEAADGKGVICYCYTSDSAGLVFNFDGANGRLRSVETYESLEPDVANTVTTNAVPLTDDQRAAESIAMAQMLLIPNQIGELRMDEIMATQAWDRFIVNEYYDGQPTGTSVTVAWEGSTIMGAIPHFGTIFTKDEAGNITPAHDGEKITEAQAIDAALKALREKGKSLDEKTARCELVIVSGDYCYEVFVQGVSSTTYGALIDVYTGEILELTQSA